ncbi:hypothetical protein OGAPHI_003311 [Ogataea philodendri]|uniref:Uncharacterized protein n=1 Tax=Ogataea philodendri TaxID=1378263 RepID=A0A9P8P7S3_9ASCO|nr:uncharacterized protein OGAPHI_003311 [Ogataea philodendri]KAH3666862.1 hypothetical protein OGAPHI_003311 [Ogataea philodendri]
MSVFMRCCLASSSQLGSELSSASVTDLEYSWYCCSWFSWPFHADPTSHHLPFSLMLSMSLRETLIGSPDLIRPSCFLHLVTRPEVASDSMLFSLLFFRLETVSTKNRALVLELAATFLLSKRTISFKEVGSSDLSLYPQDRISLRSSSVLNSVGLEINLSKIMS